MSENFISAEFIESLKNNKYQEHLDEIKDALSILDDAIESLESCLLDEAATLLKQRCFEKSNILSGNTQALENIRSSIKGYISKLEYKDNCDEEKNNDSDLESKINDQLIKSSQSNTQSETSKTFNLAKSVDVTHHKPILFKFKHNQYQVSSWRDLLLDLCFILYKADRDIILQFPNKKEFMGRKKPYFSFQKNLLRYACRIHKTNLYVEGNLSAKLIVNLVIKILKEYRIDPSHLEVEIRRSS
ncbi:MAG: hypothetical protein SWJ54_16995 [Cyanobacteriota bacterium]|nr:hypothetical protein [Cyanobacteriota bacterium]